MSTGISGDIVVAWVNTVTKISSLKLFLFTSCRFGGVWGGRSPPHTPPTKLSSKNLVSERNSHRTGVVHPQHRFLLEAVFIECADLFDLCATVAQRLARVEQDQHEAAFLHDLA